MLILLDCRPLLQAEPGSERSHFIFSVTAALARDHAVKWLFLVDQSFRPDLFPQLTGSTVLIQRAFPGRTGWRMWYDWQLPRLAKKYKTDLVMLTGGITARSLSVPQCLWMPERADPAAGEDYLPMYPSRLKESLHRAALTFCYSPADRNWLSGQIKDQDPEKLVVLSPWPSEAALPLSAEEREKVKQDYAQGKEYFLADVSAAGLDEIVQLLRSFSLFKKRQLSNLQLVLAGRRQALEEELKSRLETYKYRQDIHWCDPAEMGAQLAGAAYARLFPSPGKTLGFPVLDAWKADIPVIIGRNSGLLELAGEAALVAESSDPASLAGHLMDVYKNEQLRRTLIEKGRSRVTAFSRQQSFNGLWDGITRVIQQRISG